MPDLPLNLKIPILLGASRIHAGTCPPPGISYGKRVVRHYELDLITWGEGIIHTNGQKMPAVRGSLFIREPGMEVEGITPYHCYYLILELAAIEMDGSRMEQASYESALLAENNPDTFSLPPVLQLKNIGAMEALFSRTYNEYILGGPTAHFSTRALLMQIFTEIMSEWNSGSRFDGLKHVQREHLRQILEVRDTIEADPAHAYTLDQLADLCGLSRYFFCRKFREVTGASPIEYMNKCRISQAKRLLIETGKSIKEIMLDCGFENESHFFRLFKRLTGTTPTMFSNLFKP